jgi:hypothetical protein
LFRQALRHSVGRFEDSNTPQSAELTRRLDEQLKRLSNEVRLMVKLVQLNAASRHHLPERVSRQVIHRDCLIVLGSIGLAPSVASMAIFIFFKVRLDSLRTLSHDLNHVVDVCPDCPWIDDAGA